MARLEDNNPAAPRARCLVLARREFDAGMLGSSKTVYAPDRRDHRIGEVMVVGERRVGSRREVELV